MKKIFITGSSGFIGRNLKEKFEGKYHLFAPDRKELDLTDQNAVRGYLERNSFDAVIHCANTNDFLHDASQYDILNRNLQMFFNLESCSGSYGKMIYFGSGAEYGMEHYVPLMDEEYFGTYIPQDPYGFSKYIMSRAIDHDSNIIELRLFGVYGKYEEWQRRFISNNLCRSIKGMDMTINKNTRLDYLYIDDLCGIVGWFLWNNPKYRHYNVCTGNALDLLSIANMINKVTGMQRNVEILEDGWKPEYSGNNQRLMEEISHLQFTPMESAIEELYQYYLENGDFISFETGREEDGRVRLRREGVDMLPRTAYNNARERARSGEPVAGRARRNHRVAEQGDALGVRKERKRDRGES